MAISRSEKIMTGRLRQSQWKREMIDSIIPMEEDRWRYVQSSSGVDAAWSDFFATRKLADEVSSQRFIHLSMKSNVRRHRYEVAREFLDEHRGAIGEEDWKELDGSLEMRGLGEMGWWAPTGKEWHDSLMRTAVEDVLVRDVDPNVWSRPDLWDKHKLGACVDDHAFPCPLAASYRDR